MENCEHSFYLIGKVRKEGVVLTSPSGDMYPKYIKIYKCSKCGQQIEDEQDNTLQYKYTLGEGGKLYCERKTKEKNTTQNI